MELLIALAFIGGVVYLVSRLKPGTPEDAPFGGVPDEDGYDEPALTGKAPSGWVAVRESVGAPEGVVAQGLLR